VAIQGPNIAGPVGLLLLYSSIAISCIGCGVNCNILQKLWSKFPSTLLQWNEQPFFPFMMKISETKTWVFLSAKTRCKFAQMCWFSPHWQ